MENKILTLKDLAVEHDYYCSDNIYYSNEAQSTHETFNDFMSEMGQSDIDMNLCFRWDINQYDDGTYRMQISIMHQRKGRYWPNHIEKITEEDVPNIIAYLKPHLEKLKQLWTPFTL